MKSLLRSQSSATFNALCASSISIVRIFAVFSEEIQEDIYIVEFDCNIDAL